ncbi:hypothetical protein HDU96_009096 [Phlyctochytrium bullatum]|nr:hypothetical protein HDU96_009096 [Phlyctochytrium bullatum]
MSNIVLQFAMMYESGAARTVAVLILLASTWQSALAEDESTSLQRRAYPKKYTLPSEVFAFGRPCIDRNFWEAVRSVPNNTFSNWKVKADRAVQNGLPPWNETSYRNFQTQGTREGDGMMKTRYNYIYSMTIAECMEGKGTCIPHIDQAIQSYCSNPTWSYPSHDKKFRHYGTYPEKYMVDLNVAFTAAQLSQLHAG